MAVQVLFHLEYTPGDPEAAFATVNENFNVPSGAQEFAQQLVQGVYENREALDRMIRRASRNWRLERMSRVDRCILRIGAFEVAYLKDIPAKVSIDEAVELGKRFGSRDSGSFINGILDNIFNPLPQSEE